MNHRLQIDIVPPLHRNVDENKAYNVGFYIVRLLLHLLGRELSARINILMEIIFLRIKSLGNQKKSRIRLLEVSKSHFMAPIFSFCMFFRSLGAGVC